LFTSNSQRLNKKEQEVKNVVEQPAECGNCNIQSLQNFRVIHKSSISLNTSQISSIHAIAPILSTKEPEHLLSMRYEHLNITPETESNEVTESNAENLLPILSKCEVTLEDKIECDMPAKDDCSPVFTTFSNPLFKDNDDLDSSNNESLPDEDVPVEEFKIYSNPLFDEEEINSDKLDSHYFNVEYDFVESFLNRDTFIDFSSKFDFSSKLDHIKPEIPKSDFNFEEEIRLIENLLYDKSSPRQPEELNAEIADAIIESIPSLPIPVWDGDSQREEIDIVTETDDVLPPSAYGRSGRGVGIVWVSAGVREGSLGRRVYRKFRREKTMAQMLQAPIEGDEDAIAVLPINANNFELKQTLINLVQSNQFTGEAGTWLDKEPPRSILTWQDLVSKFINQFFPPSKTTYLRNEIINFLQKPNETFNETWEHFKNLVRQGPHHGFSKLHQLDTFYNALNPNDQDALDSAAKAIF
nr:hypothetical protein [Tanacetum cinerariifolium]